jgi:PAS domain S-box-containing protein
MLLTVMLDITEQRRATEALRHNERFLASVFASIQDGLSILDDELTIVRVNPTMERWYSYAMPLVGKKCYQAYHGRSAPCENCPAQQALATGQAAYAVVSKKSADGQVAGWLDLYAFPRLDVETGQAQGVIEYVRDITERKAVEEALYERNRDLALLNEVSQMLTATLDLHEVTGRLITALTHTLGAEGASVWVWDGERPGGPRRSRADGRRIARAGLTCSASSNDTAT